jgi:hypothetical protein
MRGEGAAQRFHETADAGEPMNGVEVDLLHERPLPDHVRFAKRTILGDSREQEIR